MEIGKGNGKVYVGIPRERFYFTEFSDNRDNILGSIHDAGIGCGYFQSSGHRVDLNRDRIVKAFLEHKENPEWLLMLDSDMEHVPDIAQRLIRHKKPIVGALYFFRGDSHDPLVFRRSTQEEDEYGRLRQLWAPLRDEVYNYLTKANIPKFDGAVEIDNVEGSLVEVDAIGTGAILIHKSVFETMPGPWFEYVTGAISEDIRFCDVAKYEYNIPVYCDFSTISGHYKLAAMGQTQFRAKYEGRGMQFSSYSSDEAKGWLMEFLGKSKRYVNKLFAHESLGHEFGDYWRTLNVDSDDKERKVYRDKKSALPYLVELLIWNSSPAFINLRNTYTNVRNANVIEIGSGIGTLALQMAIQRNNVLAIEVNPVLRDFIKFRYKKLIDENIETVVGPIIVAGDEWLTADMDKMDYAFAIDVFEHMPLDDLKTTLVKLSEVMKPGGRLFYHANWGQQDIYPMHHDYGSIWTDILLGSKFYPITPTMAQRM